MFRMCQLFTTAKTWKQTVEYYSATKNEIIPFATWVDLEIIILSEVSQRMTHIIYNGLYME